MPDQPLVDPVDLLSQVLTGQGEAAEGQTVIAAAQADHDLAPAQAAQCLVLPGELDREIVGRAARGGEQHPYVVVGTRELDQGIRRTSGVLVFVAEDAQVRGRAQSFGSGIGDGLIAVPEVGVPQAAGAAEQFPPVGEPHTHAFRGHRAQVVPAVLIGREQRGPQCVSAGGHAVTCASISTL